MRHSFTRFFAEEIRKFTSAIFHSGLFSGKFDIQLKKSPFRSKKKNLLFILCAEKIESIAIFALISHL
jgi:hypothetical protein